MSRNHSAIALAVLFLSVFLFPSCKKKDYLKVIHDPVLYQKAVHEVNYVIINDIFTPPVASRIFSYSNLAAFEVLAKEGRHFHSLQGKVNQLNNIPDPPQNSKIDFPFASLIALTKVGQEFTFSHDRMQRLIDSIKTLAVNEGMPDNLYESSVAYGEQVADSIISWSKKDNYARTRNVRFSLTGLEGHWEPTPPGYLEGVEPKWGTMRTLVLSSPNMFPPPGPPPFSKDSSSAFYKMAKDVMDVNINLTPEQKAIADFWDCNGFKLNVKGHTMFATKAMTPVGHWMEVVGTISKNNHSDFYKTVYAYTGVSIGIYDAFICCWYTKYKYDVLRPETYITKYINTGWQPYLQTPPFPEYNSAHSTISAAAATILNQIYHGHTAFRDSSERNWGWPDRNFKSTDEAAKEVSLSRLYGGIHYRKSVWDAYNQGKKIGALVMEKLSM